MDFRKHILLALLGFFLSAFQDNVINPQNPDNFIVIGNEIGTKTITRKQLTAIFKSEKAFWSNGNPVLVVIPSVKNELVNSVAKEVYKTSVSGMQKFWVSLVFQGRANAPHSFDNDEETIKFIQKNKGAIGFISKNNAEKAVNLLIDTEGKQ
jgi:ABC-type phosphate transport system substrate-binding protein